MEVDTSKKFCSILFDVFQEKGLRHVVCSPGTRNVPLLLAVAHREIFKKHFIVDERSAAFFALGISLVKQQPVALICTSGTALLNYAPAIAEAYYQSIPLIVISADRPEQWIDQDDSQTLRQDNALSNFVKKSYTIPALGDSDPEMQWYVNRIANDAMMEACGGRKGPVHLNIHLSEPLNLKQIRDHIQPRIIDKIQGDKIANKEIYRELAYKISKAKVMVVAGFGLPDFQLQKAIALFSSFPNVTVFAETISNLHFNSHAYSIDSVLTAYSNEELDNISPDIVLSLGGALVSRKLKEYLRRNKYNSQNWSIGYSHTTSDPFMSLSLRIEVNPSIFFKNITSVLKKFRISPDVKDYQDIWEDKRVKALLVKQDFINKNEWSELKAFDIILKNIPYDYNLFLSNGTAVRYAQIIDYPLPHASYCNRGVSGIDGSVSTAMGGCMEYKGKTLLITGDLSFIYDMGALSIKDIPEKFKIIVIDNQGGGIFRFIPATSSLEEREDYLCQPPHLPLKELAKGFGWNYYESNNETKLLEDLNIFLKEDKKSILKISCNGQISAEILKKYMCQRV